MRSKGSPQGGGPPFSRAIRHTPRPAGCGAAGLGGRAGCGQPAARSGAGSRQPADGRSAGSWQLAAGNAAGGHAVIGAAAAAHSRNGALPRISTGGQLGGAGGGCWLRGQVARTRAKSEERRAVYFTSRSFSAPPTCNLQPDDRPFRCFFRRCSYSTILRGWPCQPRIPAGRPPCPTAPFSTYSYPLLAHHHPSRPPLTV